MPSQKTHNNRKARAGQTTSQTTTSSKQTSLQTSSKHTSLQTSQPKLNVGELIDFLKTTDPQSRVKCACFPYEGLSDVVTIDGYPESWLFYKHDTGGDTYRRIPEHLNARVDDAIFDSVAEMRAHRFTYHKNYHDALARCNLSRLKIGYYHSAVTSALGSAQARAVGL